ncbi:MAG: ABC transporter permease [Bacteroidales bacterium]|nr:ABC transporter permease [Bacteroidales bacterium]
MRTIGFILQKEFIQIFRNKTMLPIIFIVPVVQLLILVHAATFDMKHIDMYVVDKDLSSASRQLVSKFEGSPFFFVNQQSFSVENGEDHLITNEADVVLHIHEGFEKDLMVQPGTKSQAKMQLLINAVNGTKAGLINAYSTNVIADFRKEIIKSENLIAKGEIPSAINVNFSHWYNPELNYKIFMLPGILVILITIIGMFLSALNLVREKEMGTSEQINVTPIRKYQFIIGKLLPFWIIALFELAIGLVIGYFAFSVPILGNISTLVLFAAIYLFAVLGIGLFISTVSSTQQQVMFVSFFFMLTFILMSGIFTPVESMPGWAQNLNIINPFAYFIRVIRMILLKGSDMIDISREIVSMSLYALISLSFAVWRYRKVA